jgi:hypothetical protein
LARRRGGVDGDWGWVGGRFLASSRQILNC